MNQLRNLSIILIVTMISISGCLESEEASTSSPPPPKSEEAQVVPQIPAGIERASYKWKSLEGTMLGFVNLTAIDKSNRIEVQGEARIFPREKESNQNTNREISFTANLSKESGEIIEIRMPPFSQNYTLDTFLIGEIQQQIGDPILIQPSFPFSIAPHPVEHYFSKVGNALLAFPQELIPSSLTWIAQSEENHESWGPFAISTQKEGPHLRINGTAPCMKFCTFNYAPRYEATDWQVTALIDEAGIWPLEFGYYELDDYPRGAKLFRTSHEGAIELDSSIIQEPEKPTVSPVDCGVLPCEEPESPGLDDAMLVHELNPNWIVFQSSQDVWLSSAAVYFLEDGGFWVYEFVGSAGEGRAFVYQEFESGVILPVGDRPLGFHHGPEFYEGFTGEPLFQNLDQVVNNWLTIEDLEREDIAFMGLFVRPPLNVPEKEVRAEFELRVENDSSWWLKGSMYSGQLNRVELVP